MKTHNHHLQKDLLIEQAVKPKGKASIMWSDDPSSEQTIFSDHKNTAEKILNSDNPQGDGLTKTTPVITDGTATETETNTDTTTNTDVNENNHNQSRWIYHNNRSKYFYWQFYD